MFGGFAASKSFCAKILIQAAKTSHDSSLICNRFGRSYFLDFCSLQIVLDPFVEHLIYLKYAGGYADSIGGAQLFRPGIVPN